MKLTKQTLKRIIKEELDAVMNEQDDPRKAAGREFDSAGLYHAHDPKTRNLSGKAMTYDYNNSYIAFQGNDRDISVYYIPETVADVNYIDILEKHGFRRGSFAIHISNLPGAPKGYLDSIRGKNPNRRVVGI